MTAVEWWVAFADAWHDVTEFYADMTLERYRRAA